jgi:copper transport protein
MRSRAGLRSTSLFRRLHAVPFVLACVASLAWAPAAFAHAQLLATTPAAGSTVQSQPREVIFKFNENVGGTLGAVRVYDAHGNEVDDLRVSHPRGHERWMGVGLKPSLADGTYTATYRVVSADTHIVDGGLVFSVGHPGAPGKLTVAGLIARNQSGEVTAIAFGVVRSLDYLTIALLIGGLAFMLVAWQPALAAVSRPGSEWQLASRAFERRMRWLLSLAVVLGLLVSVLGILLQGASAAGVSLWASVKGPILESTLESRFGEVWGLRVLAWLALAVWLSAMFASRSHPSKPRIKTVAPAAPTYRVLAPIILAALYLAATPALGGHASVQSPTVLFLPSDVLHVLAASVWVGGIACLLYAVPPATRELAGPERSRVLLAVLARFSPIALAAVVVIALSGVVQAYIDVRTLSGLFNTTYGALIVVKTALLVGLIGLGWVNRSRVIPALERLLAGGRSPGATGLLARRTMRGELTLMLAVFGVTAALTAHTPPIDAASGPFSANTTLGPAELEMTVAPARVGPNTIHVYLFDAKTGAQFTATRELTVKAELPSKRIGPLTLAVTPAGPGHYILSSAELTPGGTWEIRFTDRVSEFEEFSRSVSVPIG